MNAETPTTTKTETKKVSPSSIATCSPEPKKSARLAEKRKHREETGHNSISTSTEDDFYFTPIFPSNCKVKASTPSPSGVNQIRKSDSPTSTTSTTCPITTSTSQTPSKSIPSALSPTPTKSNFKPVLSPEESSSSSSLSSPASASSTFSSAESGSSRMRITSSNTFPPSGIHHEHPHQQQLNESRKQGMASSDEDSPTTVAMTIDRFLEKKAHQDLLRIIEVEGIDVREWAATKNSTERENTVSEKDKGPDLPTTGNTDNISSTPNHTDGTLAQEMAKKRAEKCHRRRVQALQKKELDKKRTLDKVLKKSQSKGMKLVSKIKPRGTVTGPKISISIRKDLNTISFPPEVGLPALGNSGSPKIPPVIKCGVEGCSNPKKYNCSKTAVPLCSLECYKKNLQRFTV